ncbi:hypothetical protein Goshw_021946 [Gossypium schwendimanii]|uniref:Uncharacterized protein n=1 Tax=Gossypium schwendimanii TaxID=34291 RepID=A0A7J9ML95_GOSSC|nr:hypothetical protein [Gossypium schwendimanii]
MTVVEFMVKLGLGKDKLGSSKLEERDICEKDHKEDVVDGNGNGDNSGCESVRGSLSSKGTIEQTRSPRSLVRAREKSKPRGQRGAKRNE